MEQPTNLENQNLDQNLNQITPQKNNYKILFFASLGLLLIVGSVLTTLLITQKSSKQDLQINNTQETKTTPTETNNESVTPIPSETTIESVTSSAKTSFQKLIVNWSSYKELTNTQKDSSNPFSGWNTLFKTDNQLYSFAQKIINGSIKLLVIDENNLSTILTLKYYFFITPNYENWSNDQFLKSGFIPFNGIGSVTPLRAYPDKLVWTTSDYPNGCPTGAEITGNQQEDQKIHDQCNQLTKSIDSAFN